MTNPEMPAEQATPADATEPRAEEAFGDEAPDTEAAAEAEVAAEGEPEADPVAALEQQLAERTEDLQRVTAEYANYRRRTDRERSQIVETAKASVCSAMLPLLDDLDLAEQHGDLETGPLKAFADKFRGLATDHKVAEFGAEGDAFDPEIHEAVQDLSSGDEKVIGTVLRKGYRVGERLVRNAMVIISDAADSTHTAESAESAETSESAESAEAAE